SLRKYTCHSLPTQAVPLSDLHSFPTRRSSDLWSSEQGLHDNGLIDKALRLLQARGHLFEQGGALWFRSSAFGDEKDRVVRRENGQYTYFASDIAYHLDKFERGFDRVIDVWGADHHGYVPRVKGALGAFGLDPGRLEIALVQFAVLYRNGEKLAMGKRSGEFVTLRELAAEFHSYYNAERILVDDETLRSARLALSAAVRQTLANGLSLLGVSAPEKM